MCLALLAVPLLLSLGASGDALPASGWSATATPTTNLLDGQRMTVNIKSRADLNVVNVVIRECRAEATYVTEDDALPRSGKCPAGPVSSSADSVISRNAVQGIIDRIHDPAGMNLLFRIGVGTVQWKETTGEFALTCDPDHPCALVVQLQFQSGEFVYQKIPLTFAVDDPIAACGGPAAGVLNSAGSDQMIDLWSSWTREFCTLPGSAGAPTRATFGSEGLAVRDFSSGTLDLAYTAAGYDNAVGLGPTDATKRRNAVTTPVALNAAVIAVGGGYNPPPGEKVPYPEIKLTAAEVAAIFGGGLPWVGNFNQPYRASILARNPVLGGELNFVGGVDSRPAVASSIESSSWFMSNFLLQRSPADWINPGSPPQPRGATAAFAVADPPFPELNTFSGRPSLRKVVDPLFASTDTGPLWVLTDLATARALGLTPVSIQTASGAFVAPTTESMLAAVPTMHADENGLLLPDPNAVAGASAQASAQASVEPYPLTYVEYAMTPAEPLVDTTTCTLRSGSQALLAKWLAYATGDGQKNQPSGLVALPASLATDAQQSLGKVGTAAVTGACAGRITTPGATGAPGGSAGGAAAGALPSATGPRAGAIANSALVPGALTPSAAAGAGDGATTKETLAAIPAFAGHSLPDTSGGIVALLGIVLVTSLAAWLTAGQRAGPVLAGSSGSTGMTMRGASGSAVARAGRPRPGGLILLWVGVAATGVGLVVYQLGPLLQQRDQHDLIKEYRTQVREAANSGSGLPGATVVTKAPEPGAPVGVLEIGGLQEQAVVVEGVTPSQTQRGPGHAPGTAGLGQPGNSVLVARRNGYGGAFAHLADLKQGAPILVTTTQGQSVYRVRSVRTVNLVDEISTDRQSTVSATAKSKGYHSGGTVTVDQVYGPTDNDRLTLVTSGSRAFWNTSSAVVVTARLVGKPFEPTPQGGRSNSETGRQGDSGAWSSVILAVLVYGAAIVASVMLYRRMRFRVAYILTVAPLVALTVVTGETLSRLLPAWM